MTPSTREMAEDTNRLARMLRLHSDPGARIEAAEVFASSPDSDCIEPLIRAALSDPNHSVRAAAETALIEQLGVTEAQQALTAYGDVTCTLSYEIPVLARTENPPDHWVDNELNDSQPDPFGQEIPRPETPVEYLDFASEEKSIRWDDEDISPLILILKSDSHPERQMKALRIIAGRLTPAGLDAISYAAIWSENPLVKKTALRIIKDRYGEDTESFLADFTASQNAGASLQPPFPTEDGTAISDMEQQATSEEMTNAPQTRPQWFFLILFLVGIAALTIYFLFLR